ncbi:endoribonuclease L-PSP [Aureococcus anophagefferens]|nr:endoribonuclease L-PSP [Aureococcus anophagefferens]
MPNPRAAAAVVHNGTVYLSGQIWVKTMGEHFAPMNEVWNAYVAEIPDCKGVRACVESEMARPSILVEIQVVAAL